MRQPDRMISRHFVIPKGYRRISLFEFFASGTLLGLGLLLGGCASRGEHVILLGAAHQGRSEAILKPDPNYELLSLKVEGGRKIAAEFGTALDANGRPITSASQCPTMLFSYGNGTYWARCQGLFERLRRLGFNVMIPEYPGYGMSEGRASENGCYAAADAAYAYVMSRSDIDRARIIVASHSLGGGVSIDLASRRHVAALITLSTFTSTRDVLQADLPGPLRWLAPAFTAHCKFESLSKVPNVSYPILIIHGTADTLVPPWMAQRLANAATTKVTCLSMEGADHISILDPSAEEPWEAITKWIRDHFPTEGED
jgi:fermentation-respiration switch protein FrsA (DUF1100 family)